MRTTGISATFVVAVLVLICAPAAALRIECITPATTRSAVNCTAADDPWDCCTGSGAGATCDDLSATAIRVDGHGPVDYEIYASSEAEDAPTECTPVIGAGAAVTCAGYDTTGEAELWSKCDPNAPWLQTNNTTAVNAASGAARWGQGLDSDCLYALKITDTGSGDDACFYLSIVSSRLNRDQETQDGVDTRRTTELVP